MSSVEYVPVAQQFVAPYPKPLITDYTGDEALTSVSSGGGVSTSEGLEQLPTTQDLSWVAGDTVTWAFFFENVCWTPVDPSPTQFAWEYVTWRSQVRTTKAYYYGYWWPPTFPLGHFILEFNVNAQYAEDDPQLGTGTLVTLTGGTTWPGTFAWDLQSEHHTDPLDLGWYEARTHLQGKATVKGQVTNPQITVPSHWGGWGVYPYP